MFKKINGEDKSQKLQKILSKFNQIKSTVMNLKKVNQNIILNNYYFIFIE